MDKNILVKDLFAGGQKLVEELQRRGLEVATTMWLMESDEEKWRFYIVSPNIDTEGHREAFMRLHPLIVEIEERFGFDPNRIRLIGPSNPLAREMLTYLQRVPGPPRTLPFRFKGRILGNMAIEEAYFCPVPAPAKT